MSPENTSDEELIEQIRRHDENALQELMRRYCGRLADYAYTLLRRRDLAEEAVSNVLIAIWRRRETLMVRGTVRSYLFGAVGNQSLTLRKSEMPANTVWLSEEVSRDMPDNKLVELDIIYRDLSREIDALISLMPPQRQLIFRLNRFDGLRYSEIAEALGIAEQTVQNHMVQAVKQLAQELPRLRDSLSRSPFN